MNTAFRPIIVVEDSDEDFDTVQQAIQKAGVHADVRRASTGGDCLDLLRGADPVRPAFVLMDLNTPGTDGRQAIQAIKSDNALKAVPVIALSTSANPKDVAFCYHAGANAYHVKPVRYTDHLQIVIDLITYWFTRTVLPENEGVGT